MMILNNPLVVIVLLYNRFLSSINNILAQEKLLLNFGFLLIVMIKLIFYKHDGTTREEHK